MAPLLMTMILFASNGSCRQESDPATGPATASIELSPTSARSDAREVNKLLPATNISFRVEFNMTSNDAASGTVVWRQSLGARRIDFWVSGPTSRGGFGIDTEFDAGNFPGSLFYCDWVPRDADLVSVDCLADPHGGPPVKHEFLPTISYGFIDRRLPARSVIGVSAQCYGVEKGITSVGGEICVEPTRHIPLYYASESGTVLEASRYATDAGASTFSSDLVLRVGGMSPTVLSRSDLELP